MYNLYRGNTGRSVRVEERKSREAASSPPPSPPPMPVPHTTRSAPKPLLGGLTELLPKTLSELESEDILLMLILYLMYRESGDSELLMIMGAMFLV